MPVKKPSAKPSIRDAIINPDSFATTLVICMIDTYGTEFLSWSPQTIRMESEDDFGVEWPQANFDRLMAGMALLTTDSFYNSLPDFIDICNILSGAPATPGVFDPADAAECAWGIAEAILLCPPEEEEGDIFSDEIRAYIGKITEMEGMILPPDILRLGLRDTDHQVKVNNTYSDDPEMFQAIWDMEASKTEDINSLMKERLALLISQLSNLHLANGSTENVAKKMLANLQKPKDSPLP